MYKSVVDIGKVEKTLKGTAEYITYCKDEITVSKTTKKCSLKKHVVE